MIVLQILGSFKDFANSKNFHETCQGGKTVFHIPYQSF